MFSLFGYTVKFCIRLKELECVKNIVAKKCFLYLLVVFVFVYLSGFFMYIVCLVQCIYTLTKSWFFACNNNNNNNQAKNTK